MNKFPASLRSDFSDCRFTPVCVPVCFGIGGDFIGIRSKLSGRLNHIFLMACSVANVAGVHWSDKESKWVPGGNGYALCSQLAGYTKAYVTAADAQQKYFKGIPGLLDADMGSWEGNVYTWGPNGYVYSVGWE